MKQPLSVSGNQGRLCPEKDGMHNLLTQARLIAGGQPPARSTEDHPYNQG